MIESTSPEDELEERVARYLAARFGEDYCHRLGMAGMEIERQNFLEALAAGEIEEDDYE